MLRIRFSRIAAGAALALASHAAAAAPMAIDTASSLNGITDIYSATFDGALSPCTGSSPSYCAFFGGTPGAVRNITISPTPTGVANGVPGGFASAPAAGSFLNVTVDGSHTMAALAGGTIAFPTLSLTINGAALGAGSAVVVASGAGMVIDPAVQEGVLNADGQAEYLVNLAPATAADFSTLSQVVTSCTPSPGATLCGLLPILSLDMVRYRLFLDFDPTFTSFTGEFIGQTSNNSMIFATLDSTVVPVPAAGWLLLPAAGAIAARARRRRN